MNDTPAPQALAHAMTVDVEDYFQVSAFNEALSRDDWSKQSSRVVANTERLLDLYDTHNIKITFFVLGMVAEQFPDLVKQIHSRGHEVASHGYSHKLIFEQSPDVFHEETKRSKLMLEDLIGQAVRGYRAASYSITKKSLWALDTLTELGFDYDSSIFPVHHDRYGIPEAPREIHRAQSANGGVLTEFPLSTALLGSTTIPIAGGGYFRIYPYWLTNMLWRRAIAETEAPQVFYLHPWEIDPDQPKIDGLSLLSKFRHYFNLGKCEKRLAKHMNNFSFTTMASIIDKKNAGPLKTVRYTPQAFRWAINNKRGLKRRMIAV